VSAPRSDQELLQRDAFDETSPEERAALHQRLSADPALRAEHERLLDLRRRLDQVGLVDPPPGFVSDVRRAARQAGARGDRGAWLAPLLARRPALALAASLAIGIGAGVLLSGFLGQGSWPAVDESQVAGTILSRERADLPVVDRIRLEGAGLRAEAVARTGRGVVVADLVIEPPRTAEVFVETGGSGLRPRGFEALDGLAAGAILEAGGVYVADARPGHYRLALATTAAGSGEIRIRLQSPDGRVDGSLHLGPVSAPDPLATSKK
jgi:hypothetical protein